MSTDNLKLEQLMKKTVLTGAVLAGAMFLSTAASASYTTFAGEDLNDDSFTPLSSLPNSSAAETSFKSNLSSGVSTETFEGQATGATVPLTLNFTDLITSAITTATLSGGGGQVVAVSPGNTDGNGRYSIPSATSSKFWQVNAGGSSTFTITFSDAIAAFGFYGVDIGDFGGTVSVNLLDGSGNIIQTVAVPATQGSGGSTDGSVIFFGVVSSGAASDFMGISFSTTAGGGDVFAFDNFTIATRDQVVPPNGTPLPGTILLAGLGLLGLGAARRRQR
jgi:hypothetical protein